MSLYVFDCAKTKWSDLPDILIVGKQDHSPGVASVQQQADDFVEVGRFVVMRDLQGLSYTDPTWGHTAKGSINIWPFSDHVAEPDAFSVQIEFWGKKVSFIDFIVNDFNL